MSVTILVVEDDGQVRSSVRELLVLAGYVVHVASSPDEAIVQLATLPRPCLLLWDALTPRHALEMIDLAIMEGVHVATLPVSLAPPTPLDPMGGAPRKRLTSAEAVLNVVHEHCPVSNPAGG